ncbi:MAG: DinB family protein [Beutenbergiaceae bacterium]
MAIEPDTKDWTWVLERACECGFDPAAADPDGLPVAIATTSRGWRQRLQQADARRRPSSATWSALEYGAHVRDMARVMTGRLALILDQDDPIFPDWDQDEAAVAANYREQDPAVVADELELAIAELAGGYAHVQPQAWDRRGRRSNGAHFTAYTLGLYALHDLQHHRRDVAILDAADGS